jgi:Ca-activated chloride channel family protein
MTFQDSWILLFLPLVIGFLLLAHRRRQNPALQFPTGEFLDPIPASWRVKLFRFLPLLRVLSVALVVLALGRPQWVLQERKTFREGVDILLALDVSGSMLAEDFQVGVKRESRLDAVKRVVSEFVRGRPEDRMGLIAFAAHAYPLCPLTRDHEWLLGTLEGVHVGMIQDNTALGSGLSSALNRLKETPAKGKVVVLLTDGRNNAGKVSPLVAAAAARALNVTVHTVGAGSQGPVPYPMKDPLGGRIYKNMKLDIDEEVLKAIASQTGGRYFRATDMDKLKETFKEIDRLEKTPLEEKVYHERQELFPLFLIPGLILLTLEMILRHSIFRTIP